MNTEEQRLSDWLHEQTPAPPASIDLSTVVDRSRKVVGTRPATRSSRRWAPLLAAAAAVAVLAAVLAALPGRGQDSPPATPSPTPTGHFSTSTPTPTETSDDLSYRPWHARLIRKEQYSTLNLTAIGAFLYRISDGLERIDPATGRIAARGSVPGNTRTPVVAAAGRLWVASQPGTARVVLTGYDPLTLTQLAQYRYPVVGHESNGPALASASSTLYLGAGSQVLVLDARTGRQTRTFRVADGMSSLAVSPDGTRLVVATGPQGNQAVEQLDATTGVARGRRFTRGGGCSDLQATSGGIYVTCGQGMLDNSAFFTYGGRYRGEVDGGGGIPAAATVSGGVVWIGGPQEAACADPGTGRVRAHITLAHSAQGAALTGLSVVHGRLYAEYTATESLAGAGIVELTPPKACGLR